MDMLGPIVRWLVPRREVCALPSGLGLFRVAVTSYQDEGSRVQVHRKIFIPRPFLPPQAQGTVKLWKLVSW
jgi:hypothetical protein